jgi:hypothetical protein
MIGFLKIYRQRKLLATVQQGVGTSWDGGPTPVGSAVCLLFIQSVVGTSWVRQADAGWLYHLPIFISGGKLTPVGLG